MPQLHFSICLIALFLIVSAAEARPIFGRDCSVCHSEGEPDADVPQVVGFDSLDDPDESATGATDRGLRKVFDVEPGGEVDLQVLLDFESLTNIRFAVELKRLETSGVVNGGTLVYVADPDWFIQTGIVNTDPVRPYFTFPESEGMVFSEPRTFTFTIGVDVASTPDYYDLEFATAGQPSFFYADEHFYLRVVPEPATHVLFVLSLGILFSCQGRRR